ncbi:MAG: radical SAM protein [Nanoarchaeota archaeon]|nr:radical SAM protein [Nanoarchaeota archaeon]
MNVELSNESYYGLGSVPIGIGAVLNGWHGGPGSVLDFRAMTGACEHDCFFCFTDKRKKTLTLGEIKNTIWKAKDVGYAGIDYLGEGEPTLDKDFFEIIYETSRRNMVPVVFTDGATKLRNRKFIERLELTGASVCPKCDSLFNARYQNWIVGDKTDRYFRQRNEAMYNLILEGFNARRYDGRTRLGLDMVVTKKNINEVEKTLQFCRNNNIWIVFSTYLPSGRSGREDFDRSLVLSEEELIRMRQVVQKVDCEYGFNHPIFSNFATFPCVELMQIYGDGRVSPCPGNETIIGNIRDAIAVAGRLPILYNLKGLRAKILEQFPCHDPNVFDSNCLYRQK